MPIRFRFSTIAVRFFFQFIPLALAVGMFATAVRAADGPAPAAAIPDSHFKPLPGFKVEPVLGGQAGSIINVAFDEAGDLLVSAEDGGLYVIRNLKGGAATATASVWADAKMIHYCQGILPYNGHVYAVGKGAQGAGLYRLTDTKGAGHADKIENILKFDGEMQEHGPHAVLLGPDGFLYVMIGNFARPHDKYDPASPHRNFYEGDLVQPRYEDAGGFGIGVKAPGGVLIRTDTEGKKVELFCGGFRNAYDAAFYRAGELFTFDSDMEWDEGLPWYRPVRVNHCVPGGEYGWRSGFANSPDYFVDTLGSVYDVGRGSPTGLLFYDHPAYGPKYRDAYFMCDWSRGRILVSHLERSGATYKGNYEVFLEGLPMNVTDAEVGPDGAIYFATGGRGSQGAVFRIVRASDATTTAQKTNDNGKLVIEPGAYTGGDVPGWTNNVAEMGMNLPLLQSAWARARLAKWRRQFGEDRWKRDLLLIAEDSTGLFGADQPRALEIMQLFGPVPDATLLLRLSQGADLETRAKVVYLLGLHPDDAVVKRLVELLADPEPLIRRLSCESLVRIGKPVPAAPVVALLGDPDRFVAWAARILIERIPADEWKTELYEAQRGSSSSVRSLC